MTDKKKLEFLFKQHYRQMYRLAIIFLHDEAESKDVVHDIFAKLLMDSSNLNEETAKTYLLTCVRNQCLNLIRGRKIQERVGRLYLLDLDTTILQTDRFTEQVNRPLRAPRLQGHYFVAFSGRCYLQRDCSSVRSQRD